MEPLELLNKHCKFNNEHEIYVLFGISRKKNHPDMTSKDEFVFREIIKDVGNIEKEYLKISSYCENYRDIDGKRLTFYIYISVNARDIRKGYINFKKKLLNYEREMIYGVSNSKQFKRLDSHWISALMIPDSHSSKNKRFMLDIDTKDGDKIRRIGECLNKVLLPIHVINQETKNGWHYVTDVFDTQKFSKALDDNNLNDVCEVKHDALLFVEYYKSD